jgi:hypothetical protein
MLNGGRPEPWSPVRCPRSRVRRPDGRHEDRLPDTACRSRLGGHVHLPARHCRTGRDADRRRTIGTAAFGHPSIITTRRTARRTPDPSCGAGAGGWTTNDPSAMARLPQDCQRDRSHRSDQAAARCHTALQAAPRRTALLGRLGVERRANGDASSVMASGTGLEWPEASSGLSGGGGGAGLARRCDAELPGARQFLITVSLAG